MSKLRLLLTLTLIFIGQESIGRGIDEVSLEQEEKRQEERDQIDNRSIPEVIASTKPDRFTQTQAHLILKYVRNLIDKYYNVEPYLDLISTVIVNETLYKDTHYAFYNTTSNAWRLAQDLYTRLYAYEHPNKMGSGFKFLRFNDESIDQTAQGFLVNELKQKGLVDDNTDTKFIMLSVNLSLFGNVGFPGECSWEYFVKPQSHAKPIRAIYEKMMDRFGLSSQYIDEIMKLAEIYDTKEDTIVQILVPKDKVDDIGYLAWVKGIPAHGPTIKSILRHAKSKTFAKVSPTMEDLTRKFAKNQNDPLFKDMLAHVEAGDYSLDKFLKVYRNQPWELKEINDVTARLLFTPDVLLNPSSGVKFFRFSTVTKDKLHEYDRKLNALIKKMITEKKTTQKPPQARPIARDRRIAQTNRQ